MTKRSGARGRWRAMLFGRADRGVKYVAEASRTRAGVVAAKKIISTSATTKRTAFGAGRPPTSARQDTIAPAAADVRPSPRRRRRP